MRPLDRDIAIEPRGPGRLRVAGSLALDTVEAFGAALEPHLSPGAVLTLDLVRLKVLDSSGIRALTLAARRLQPAGRLVLVSPSERVMKVLRIAGLSRAPWFEVVHRVNDFRSAVASLSTRARERLLRAVAAHPAVRIRLARVLPDAPDDPASAPLDDLLAAAEDDPDIRAAIDALLDPPERG